MIRLLAVLSAIRQGPPTSPPPAAPAEPEVKRLDIADRHIVQDGYRAARAIHLRSTEPGLTVDVGVALEARRIDVRLRNVSGQYLFRANLDALQQRIRGLVADPGTPPSPQPDPSTR